MKKNFLLLLLATVLISILFCCRGTDAKAAPEKVMNVRQTGADSNSLTISWTPAGHAFRYQIEYCETAGFHGNTYGAVSAGAAEHSIRISPLSPGKSYYIRISALDEEGNTGNVSDPLEAVTAPKGKVGNLTQSYGDEAFLSCTWDKLNGANTYRIDWIAYDYTAKAWGSWNKQADTDASSCKLPAEKNTGFSIHVSAARKSTAGYTAYSDEYAEIFLRPVPAVPAKVTNVKMLISGIQRFWPEERVVRFGWNLSEGAQGYQYIIYGPNGKKLFSGITSDYKNVEVKSNKLTNDQFMKIKVRGYAADGSTIKYGKWSDDCYFAKCPENVKFSKRPGGSFRMTWRKIKGADTYTIYASRKQNNGYKKLGTVSKNSYLIKKVNGRKLISGKVYFFKVIANKKVGKKTYSSDNNWYFSRIY